MTNVDNMTRKEIAQTIRNAIGEEADKTIASWYAGRNNLDSGNLITRQSDMSKTDWKACYCDLVENQTPTTPTKEPQMKTPETKAPAPTLETVLEGLGMVLADSAIAPLKAGIDALKKERDQAKHDQSEQRKKQDRLFEQNKKAHDAATVASGEVQDIAQLVDTKPLSDVIGGRSELAKSVMVDVFDSLNAPRLDKEYLWPKMTPQIFAAIGMGLNVFVYGDRGTGKSSLAEQVAAVTNRVYFPIAFHAETSGAELFGFHGVEGDKMVWVPGDLLKAMQTPNAVISLEEISYARDSLIGQLNGVLENNCRSIFLGGKRHDVAPGVIFFATSNDNGSGEQEQRFKGVKALNPALVDRFEVSVELNLPETKRLAQIIAVRADIPLEAATILAKFEKDIEAGGVKTGACDATPGLRGLVACAKMIKANITVKDAFDFCIMNKAPTVDATYFGQEYVNLDTVNLGNLILGIETPAPAPAQHQDGGQTRSGFPEINPHDPA